MCVDVVVCLLPCFVATTTTTTAPATTTSTSTPAGEYSSGLQLYSDCGLCLPKQFVSLPLLAVAVVLPHARTTNSTPRRLVCSRRTTRDFLHRSRRSPEPGRSLCRRSYGCCGGSRRAAVVRRTDERGRVTPIGRVSGFLRLTLRSVARCLWCVCVARRFALDAGCRL